MKMRTRANLSLLALALLFVIASVSVYFYAEQWWSRLLLYIAEAGLVGALADLFAITALFRHPLGLKVLPHTAIIPKNRDKLVEGVVKMVEEQLLSKAVLQEKVKELQLVRLGVSYLERGTDPDWIPRQAWKFISAAARRLDLEEWTTRFERQIRSSLTETNVAPYAGKALKWALDNSDYRTLITRLVGFAAGRMEKADTKRQIKELLEHEKENMLNTGGSFSRWIKKQLVQMAESANALNLEDAAEILYSDLQRFMDDLLKPEHELRVLADEMLYKLAAELEERTEMMATVEAWKNEVLDKVSLLPSIRALLGNFRNQLVGGAEETGQDELSEAAGGDTGEDNGYAFLVKVFVDRFVRRYWEWFKTDRGIQDFLEGYVQEFIAKMIESEHALVGQIVRKTLNEFTEQRLVEFIESKVDTDLQRIRLNGALVGAALGAAFYLILHGVYQPLLHIWGL